MGADKNQSIHVLMFPWLGYGHITPYLELAKKLSSRGFTIYLCSTPATLRFVYKKITENLSESIKLVQTTNGLPSHLMPSLKEAFDLSVNDFSNILKQLKPDLLIYDVVQPWAPLVAKEHNIPAVQFITSSSTMTSFMFHCFREPWIEFPFPDIYYRDYEYSEMKRLLECDPTERDMATEGVERSSEIVLIKGFRDIEGKYIDYVTSLFGKKFVPVGPLVPEPIPDEKEDDSSGIFSWLDMKGRKSTVFVSFGSEYFLSKEDMHEIAYGLELSKINFIWVVRFPKGANGHNGCWRKHCQEDFLKAIVVGIDGEYELWGPNYSSSNSHDQPINARLVEEIGVGVEVVRERNKRLSGERLAAVIKQVVMEDCGEVVREKAAEMREKLKSKGDEEIDEVIKELVTICNNS
ncbi:UNVERIFIED_CONTAM: Beta-D-glucosyl crocetin beta-1,6-glucosyltransferase [Sesamum radiatum]|uniref:Beta-D-glucosyl crocetin beta-1,6-glucosyltransferase n=1 Tax=Sesamum radiatum TaxID=300843 RepID=A0AAW2TJ84_SESRA